MLREKVGAVDVYLDPTNIFLLHQVKKGFPGFWQYFFPFNMALIHLPLTSPEVFGSLRNVWAAHVQPGEASKEKFGQGRCILGHYGRPHRGSTTLCFLGCISYLWI